MGAVCNGQVHLILEKSQQYYHPYNSENFPRLLDGFYKTTIEGLTPPDPFLVKVTGTKLEHFFGTQIKAVSKIEYGQVLNIIPDILQVSIRDEISLAGQKQKSNDCQDRNI